jgi:hypothetical protein
MSFIEVCATSTVIPFVVPYLFIDLANETTKHSSRFLCLRPGIGCLSLSVLGFSCHWILESVASNWSLTAVQFNF